MKRPLIVAVFSLLVGACARPVGGPAENAIRPPDPLVATAYVFAGGVGTFDTGCVAQIEEEKCGAPPKAVYVDHCTNGFTLRRYFAANAKGEISVQGACSERVLTKEIDCNAECEKIGSVLGLCSMRGLDCFGEIRTTSACACE